MFDYNELVRFNVDLSRLPADATVINRPFSLYQEYRTLIWSVGGLIIVLVVVVLALISNIVLRRRAQQQVHELNRELEARVRLRTAQLETANDELESFAYSVSHDLRAPLRSIAGFSSALEEDCGDQLSTTSLDYLQRVQRAAGHMGQLIDDLLSLSRATRSEFCHERTDLSATAAEIVAELEEGEPSRHAEVRIADGLVAHGDPKLLRVCLYNLLGNAWKFTAGRQPTSIEVGSLPAGKPSDAEEGRIYFVRDNGIGFDMSYASNLFKPFRRLHSREDFPGTGIGLATVQRIIHRHGGRVWAESEPERGTTVYFTLGEEPDQHQVGKGSFRQ